MSKENKEEKLFNEVVDRLLAGEAVKTDTADNDLRSAIDFAQKMKMLRATPSESFKANLKARLLQQLHDRETQAERTNWFRSTFSRRVVWQLASTVAVILIALGISWRAGVFQPAEKTNVASLPPKSADTSGSEAIPGPTLMITSTMTGTTTPTVATAGRGIIIQANATTDKPTYLPGEAINIDVYLINDSSAPLEIQPYPPVLDITDANGQTVFTFGAGNGVQTLLSGETASFKIVWNQINAHNKAIPAGIYHLTFGNPAYDNQSAQLEFNKPISFEIRP
jgi:hypothetical protein